MSDQSLVDAYMNVVERKRKAERLRDSYRERAERAEAERDRLRACLSVLLRDIDEGDVTGGDPECVDLSITVNRADFDEARAALDGKEK